ncbi:MAG: RNA-directed DNA polymerase, partial [Candidatus Magnetoglobus multicellularis str. Araruama]
MQNKDLSFNPKENTGEALNALMIEHVVNYPNTTVNPSTLNLLEKIANSSNLKRAFKQVKRKKGSPGIDKMSVDFVNNNLTSILSDISAKLLDGSFKPTPVKRVAIPKQNGKTRNLGIPIVIDRIVQQAICQIIEPFFDQNFSEYSFGFRKHKSAKDAVKQAQAFITKGYNVFISIDLKQCFDMINHDLLFNQLRNVISDKRILKFIGRFLRAGISEKGYYSPSSKGAPQGGNLSPLLTNIFLDQIDKHLDARGLNYVRYADDITIFVKSPRAAQRVFDKTVLFIEKKLKLPVNQNKSKISSNYADILGFLIRCDNSVFIPSSKINNFKSKIRNITRRSNGRS